MWAKYNPPRNYPSPGPASLPHSTDCNRLTRVAVAAAVGGLEKPTDLCWRLTPAFKGLHTYAVQHVAGQQIQNTLGQFAGSFARSFLCKSLSSILI